jgi:hypothetical protein
VAIDDVDPHLGRIDPGAPQPSFLAADEIVVVFGDRRSSVRRKAGIEAALGREP